MKGREESKGEACLLNTDHVPGTRIAEHPPSSLIFAIILRAVYCCDSHLTISETPEQRAQSHMLGHTVLCVWAKLKSQFCLTPKPKTVTVHGPELGRGN